MTSERLKSRLTRLSKRFNLSTRIVSKPFKLSNYFSLKCRLSDPLRSCVVYKYSCSVDPKQFSYIGKTKRHLLTRIREHGSLHSNSAIFQHRISCNCSFGPENFKILRSCSSDYDLSVCEALYITKENPIP